MRRSIIMAWLCKNCQWICCDVRLSDPTRRPQWHKTTLLHVCNDSTVYDGDEQPFFLRTVSQFSPQWRCTIAHSNFSCWREPSVLLLATSNIDCKAYSASDSRFVCNGNELTCLTNWCTMPRRCSGGRLHKRLLARNSSSGNYIGEYTVPPAAKYCDQWALSTCSRERGAGPLFDIQIVAAWRKS